MQASTQTTPSGHSQPGRRHRPRRLAAGSRRRRTRLHQPDHRRGHRQRGQASAATYDAWSTRPQQAFVDWRMMPAPKRGLVVRDLGNALRDNIEPLGELVALEMGKIRAEGIGEVQEMIDICDFAVGLSRQLYGLTMHSERPGHRMYEQWHPLGPVGIITVVQLPGGGLVLERGHCRGLRRHRDLEAVVHRRRSAPCRAAHRQPGDGRPRTAAASSTWSSAAAAPWASACSTTRACP